MKCVISTGQMLKFSKIHSGALPTSTFAHNCCDNVVHNIECMSQFPDSYLQAIADGNFSIRTHEFIDATSSHTLPILRVSFSNEIIHVYDCGGESMMANCSNVLYVHQIDIGRFIGVANMLLNRRLNMRHEQERLRQSFVDELRFLHSMHLYTNLTRTKLYRRVGSSNCAPLRLVQITDPRLWQTFHKHRRRLTVGSVECAISSASLQSNCCFFWRILRFTFVHPCKFAQSSPYGNGASKDAKFN